MARAVVALPAALMVAAFAALVAALSPAAALAQGSPPPLPLVYQGQVYVDGEPMRGDGMLTVRVGDWESVPVPVRDGVFRCADPCLMAQPPSQSYIGEPVTFHLDGRYQADLTFAFPAMSQPSIETLQLSFETGGAGFSAAHAGAAGGLLFLLAVGGAGAWGLLRARRGAPLAPPPLGLSKGEQPARRGARRAPAPRAPAPVSSKGRAPRSRPSPPVPGHARRRTP